MFVHLAMNVIILIVSVALTLATIPLGSVLIRYRALYTPRPGIQGGRSALTGQPQRYGFFSLMRRIYQIEGTSGVILKGLVLRFFDWSLSFAIVATYSYIRFGLERRPWDFSKPGILFHLAVPNADPRDIIFLIFLTILLRLPFHVLIVRATTTRYILSYRRPAVAFRVLLSPKERRAPWNLFAIPGLFLGFVLQTVVPLGLTNLSGRLMYRHFDIWRNALGITLAQLTMSLGSTALCVPLYVANIRLAMSTQCPTRHSQRQDEEAGDTQRRLWDAQEAESSGLETYCREEEDPIVFRGHLHSPYTGLVDCLGTIAKEEGHATLFRGWGLSVLSLFVCV